MLSTARLAALHRSIRSVLIWLAQHRHCGSPGVSMLLPPTCRPPSPTKERPSARRMRTVRASGCTSSLSVEAHPPAISISMSNSSGISQHGTFLGSDNPARRLVQAALLCIGRVASDELPPAAPERQALRKQASTIKPQPQSVISLMTRRHAAHPYIVSPGCPAFSFLGTVHSKGHSHHVSIELSRLQRIHVHAIPPSLLARPQLRAPALLTSRRPAS